VTPWSVVVDVSSLRQDRSGAKVQWRGVGVVHSVPQRARVAA
jgi:hypothetical protein